MERVVVTERDDCVTKSLGTGAGVFFRREDEATLIGKFRPLPSDRRGGLRRFDLPAKTTGWHVHINEVIRA
jgi:hypothetical protein